MCPGLGNAKGHENPFLLALQVIWFRWHNKVAERFSKSNLTDEEAFQETKKLVIAHFQVPSFKFYHIDLYQFALVQKLNA